MESIDCELDSLRRLPFRRQSIFYGIGFEINYQFLSNSIEKLVNRSAISRNHHSVVATMYICDIEVMQN